MPKKKSNKQQEEQPAVDPSTGETFRLDETKAFEKFKHYDADNNGFLDPKETLALSVDLYHAFNPGKTLTDDQMKVMSHKLMERLDQKNSGDNDGVLSFAEFLPWYAQAAEKHWKLVHHIHDTHDKGNDGKEDDHLPTVATAARNSPAAPYETSPDQPLQPIRLAASVSPAKSEPKNSPQRLGASTPFANLPLPSEVTPKTPLTAVDNPGFIASTTMRPTNAPEKADDGSVRVSSLEQCLKVIQDNRDKILVARRLNLRDEGASKVAQALKNNTVLVELYLSQNNIGPNGAKDIAAAIVLHPTLVEVYMGYNVIADAGAKDLIDAAAKSKTIKVIDVDYAGIKVTPEPKDGNIEAVCDYFNGDMAPPPDLDSPGRLSQMLC